MNCHYLGIVLDEKDSLIARDEYKIQVDKYLLPVLKGNDYRRMARFLMYKYMFEYYEASDPVDPNAWVRSAKLKVKYRRSQKMVSLENTSSVLDLPIL